MAHFEQRARAATARGLALLRAGDFFEAHECFEEVWRSARDEERMLMHALAQLAASYHQLSLGRARASLRTWLKARDKLATLGALSSDYQRAVEAFWARLSLSAEPPHRISVVDLAGREEWPCPDYLLLFVSS